MGAAGFGGGKGLRVVIGLFGFIFLLISVSGPFTIYFGYRLILLGAVEHGFNFTAGMTGWQLGLASTSPGLFVVFCGTIISCFSLKLVADLLKSEHNLQQQGIDTPTSRLTREATTKKRLVSRNPTKNSDSTNPQISPEQETASPIVTLPSASST